MATVFCTFGAQRHQFPGWKPKRNTPSGQTWGHHRDDGLFVGVSGLYQLSGEPCGSGDTIGCGFDMNARRLWYTKNGREMDFEQDGVPGRLFPILGLEGKVSLEISFGGRKPLWAEANPINGI